jgi:anion-transporting  ArsA/GET3 family ATPase
MTAPTDSVIAGPLADVLAQHRVIICCGSGGVGKTTTAAALALASARTGRRAVVVTIDPARRLADALGLAGLTNTPSTIDGPWSGELAALMLDTEGTFNGLVAKYAGSVEQAEKILANRFYRNISGALSGTQEYMATEKLYELYEDSGFDLIVVDTPPTRNALDFLEAPGRITRFLDHPLYRIVTAPTRGIVKAVNFAAQGIFRSIGKVVGGDVIADAIGFFAAFEGMDEGFKERARKVEQLLKSEQSACVLVASPRSDTVEEATYFASKLTEYSIAVRALIVNKMHPDPGGGTAQAARLRAETFAGTDLGDLFTSLADLRQMAEGEAAHLSSLTARIEPAPVCRVPYLPFEVSDLDTLGRFADALFGDDPLDAI